MAPSSYTNIIYLSPLSTCPSFSHLFVELNTNLESTRDMLVFVCTDFCMDSMSNWTVFLCDCVLVRWDVMWERYWQLHYLGGVSLSPCACFLSLSPPSQSNIYLLPWHPMSGLLCLSVSRMELYCTKSTAMSKLSLTFFLSWNNSTSLFLKYAFAYIFI